MAENTEPRYCDYYSMLSYKEFLTLVAAGTLALYDISARTDLTDSRHDLAA